MKALKSLKFVEKCGGTGKNLEPRVRRPSIPHPFAPLPNHGWEVNERLFRHVHCKKKVIIIPVLSRDATNQALPGRELLNYSRPGRVWLMTSRLGTGITITFFYSVASLPTPPRLCPARPTNGVKPGMKEWSTNASWCLRWTL
jgi:hypothetical protein